MAGRPVIINWPIGSRHGWGIRGLGCALNWPGTLVSSFPPSDPELPPDDPRQALLAERLAEGRKLQDFLATCEPVYEFTDCAVLVPMGNDLSEGQVAHGRIVRGKPTIACPVFEDVESVRRNVENLRRYDAVVVASRWNQTVLQDLGVEARLCHEGIDPQIFNPSVKRQRHDGRFRVFSGGKAEYRKGQDLVIGAFKRFAEKHDDAQLVCAWGSPFGFSGRDFAGKWEYGSPPGSHIGRPNFHAWLERAGLKPHQYEIVEPLPNWRMAEVYGSCDVALFPNRREGGTNFVAMECMACGVPTIISDLFGHRDLLGAPRFKDKEAIVEAIEGVYSSRDPTLWGTNILDRWTWERHCAEMNEIVETL